MKKFAVILCGVVFLAACGGGGGDGGDVTPTPWPSTDIASGSTVASTLSDQDIEELGGSYVDLYTLNVANATEFRIHLESTTFDSYLGLLQGVDLNDPDLLTNWSSFLIAENDDISITSTDSEIVISLAPGSYVIAASSFDPATAGDYTLSVATLGAAAWLQNRTLGVPPISYFRGWVEFTENGQLINESDIQSIRLLNPSDSEVTQASAPLFISETPTSAELNPTTAQFESVAPLEYSGFLIDLSNQSSLQVGTWTYVVQPVDGVTRNISVDYPAQLSLLPVDTTSMTYTWNLDGSLTLNWADPADSYDQGRIIFYDATGADLFHGKFLPGVSEVTLPASLIQTLNQAGQLPSPTTISWRIHTRAYEIGGNNYARGISNAVPISWP